jgi:hypothetical protein
MTLYSPVSYPTFRRNISPRRVNQARNLHVVELRLLAAVIFHTSSNTLFLVQSFTRTSGHCLGTFGGAFAYYLTPS